MIGALARKARQLRDDPVLRRWLIERALGKVSGSTALSRSTPPYLAGMAPLRPGSFKAPAGLPTATAVAPKAPLDLALPGAKLRLEPGHAGELFRHDFADTETLLAAHRFAWLPLTPAPDPGWVAALWRCWLDRFAEPGEGWAWHPYTAAERAINLIDFAHRSGLPGDGVETIAALARHGPAIVERLEYFGERYTGNHLSNNGRGLYRLGLFLDWPECTEAGKAILLHEATRIFTANGMLREGSSHYHLLLSRNYADAWLAALRHGQPEAAEFEAIVAAALAAARLFQLPGGMPLVGDISPDCPPAHLAGLVPGSDAATGWAANLDAESRNCLDLLRNTAAQPAPDAHLADGWLRFDHGPWTGLWHVAPDGWPMMPGHGHQDCGGFELHYMDEAVFVDPGRGAYGETGAAAHYRSTAAHNTLRLDGHDPFPANRPYYDAAFRDRVAGPKPRLAATADGVTLTHHGFRRLGASRHDRAWRFSGRRFELTDRIEGEGRHAVERRLVTALPVSIEGRRAVITGKRAHYAVEFDAPPILEPAIRWRAYGDGVPASAIVCMTEAALPFDGRISIEAD